MKEQWVFGLIISAYLMRITHRDRRAGPKRVCVTNPETGAGVTRNYKSSRIYFSSIQRRVTGTCRFAHANPLLVVLALLWGA